MLPALCADRGATPGEVVAFGDMPNDLAVLPVVWRAGYVMANAHPLVLSAIDRRTLANHEDGGGSGPGAPIDRISVQTIILLLAVSRRV